MKKVKLPTNIYAEHKDGWISKVKQITYVTPEPNNGFSTMIIDVEKYQGGWYYGGEHKNLTLFTK